MEVYNRDLDFWSVVPALELPQSISKHCVVALDENRVMVIGGSYPDSMKTSIILDLTTGEWKIASPPPTERYAHGCLVTEVEGVRGVMVTGGLDGRSGAGDTFPARQTEFYQASVKLNSSGYHNDEMLNYEI